MGMNEQATLVCMISTSYFHQHCNCMYSMPTPNLVVDKRCYLLQNSNMKPIQ